MSLSILSIYIYDDDISISIYIFIWLMPVVFFSEVACVRPKKPCDQGWGRLWNWQKARTVLAKCRPKRLACLV